MRRSTLAMSCLALLILPAAPGNGQGAPAPTAQLGQNLVRNGGFEAPDVPLGEAYYKGDRMAAWHVTRGSVDLLDEDYIWAAGTGEQSIDLAGWEDGAISQRIATKPGRNYLLVFQLATNVDKVSCPDPLKTVVVRFSGNPVATITASYDGRDYDAMGWTWTTLRVSATRSTSRLLFRSVTGDSPCGPTLDSISLRPFLSSDSGGTP